MGVKRTPPAAATGAPGRAASAFALALSIAGRTAFAALAAAFLAYAGGVIPASVPPERSAAHWDLRAIDYAAAVSTEGAETSDTAQAARLPFTGESLILAGLVGLAASVPIACLAAAAAYLGARRGVRAATALAQAVLLAGLLIAAFL